MWPTNWKSTLCYILVPLGRTLQSALLKSCIWMETSKSWLYQELEGTEIKRRSRRVRCSVTYINSDFSSLVEPNVLANIPGNTTAIEWYNLKKYWKHLSSIRFEIITKRKNIDLLTGSDNPLFDKVLRVITGRNRQDQITRKTPFDLVCFAPPSKNRLTTQ